MQSKDPWIRVPQLRPGVLTQVKSDRSIVVIDPQSRKAFVFEGKVAKLWLMIEEGKSARQIQRTLAQGMGADQRKDLDREVSAFFAELRSQKLVRSTKTA